MPSASHVQTNFLGGEWSPLSQGQMAHKRYGTALARCFNTVPVEEASLVRRSGFRQLFPTRAGAYGRLIEFSFADRAPYNMEFTDSSLRLIDGTELVSDSSALVFSIALANPGVVTVQSTVDWVSGDYLYFKFMTDTQKRDAAALGNRVFIATVVSAGTQYRLNDAVTGDVFDGNLILNGLGSSSDIGTLEVHRVKEFDTPYTATQIETLRTVQNQETALLLQGEVKPRRLDLTVEPTDTSFAEFDLDEAQFLDGPYLDPVSGSIATPSGLTGTITVTLSFAAYSGTKAYKKGDYVTSAGIGYRSLLDANVNHTPASFLGTWWEVASPGEVVSTNGFTLSDIGRHIRMHSGNTSWTWGRVVGISTTGAISQSLSGSVNIGTMTAGGGVAAAFNGVTSAAPAACAQSPALVSGVNRYYVGKNYSAATDQTISSVVVTPSTLGFTDNSVGGIGAETGNVTLNLYGKGSAPSSSTDGTLLGTVTVPVTQLTQAVIVSNDVATAWKYVWVEAVRTPSGDDGGQPLCIAEAQFYSATAAAGTAATVEVLGPDLANTDAMTTWRLGVYSNTSGWPTCGCYAYGRLWLAGAIPNRVDASKANEFFNFEPTAANGTIADNNSISAIFNSAKSNKIYWLKPGPNGIVIGTDGGEFLVRKASDAGGISPTNIEAVQVTKYKCANVEPEQTPSTTMFVQKHKRKVQEYLSDPHQAGKFFAPNMSKMAKHLSISGIEELAYQEELTPVLWARMGDGSLAGCTYRRVSLYSAEDPEFFAWHQHEHGAGREFVSLCSGPSADGATDSLLVITKNPTTEVHYVELLTNLFTDGDGLTDAQYLDAALIPTSARISGTNVILQGLWEHEKQRVDVWLAGLDCGTFPVVDGMVTVPYGSDPDGLLTHAYLHAITTNILTQDADYGDRAMTIDGGMLTVPAVVGYSYTSEGQLLRPVASQDTGAANGPGFGKVKRQHKFSALLEATQGVSFGTSFSALKPADFRRKGQVAYAKDELFSGTHKGTLNDEYGLDSQICWRTTRPYPTNILALGGFIHTQDE